MIKSGKITSCINGKTIMFVMNSERYKSSLDESFLNEDVHWCTAVHDTGSHSVLFPELDFAVHCEDGEDEEVEMNTVQAVVNIHKCTGKVGRDLLIEFEKYLETA